MENPSFEEWLEEVCKRPLPLNLMKQLEILAMELVEGNLRGYWGTDLVDSGKINLRESFSPKTNFSSLTDTQIKLIKQRKFSIAENHIISSLISSGLAELYETQIEIQGQYGRGLVAKLSKYAFELLNRDETIKKITSLFISYKRKESSAFALLLHNLLENNGFDPFLDLAIQPGDNWHSTLEDYIKNRDYFIVLIGPTTLESQITIKEIEWAIQYGRIIIPIWHNGFEFKPENRGLSDEVSKVLATTHTIRITEESALAYHSAVIELLNHFGITPTL